MSFANIKPMEPLFHWKFASLMKTANIRFITSNPTKMYRIAQHILCPTELLLPQPTIFGNLNVRFAPSTRWNGFSFFIMPMKIVGRCSIHRTSIVLFSQLVLLTFSLTNWKSSVAFNLSTRLEFVHYSFFTRYSITCCGISTTPPLLFM